MIEMRRQTEYNRTRSNTMVITFVCDVLGEENNGTTIATMNVARAMQAKGHEVRFVCCDKFREGQEGFYVVPEINFGPFNHYVHSNGVHLASGKDMETVKKAFEGADVVHFNFCGVLSKRAVDLAHEMGIPCTASLHTQAENFTNHVYLDKWGPANRWLYRYLRKGLFDKVEAIHYPSQFIHDFVTERHHFANKAYIISNGIQNAFTRIEVERPEEWKGKIVVAYTARYSREKAHKELIKAMSLTKHKDEIVLVLPGAGPDKMNKKFAKWTKKWCANPPVLGFHSREEMVKILNCVDIYCHVGRVDIEPVSALEAISVGIAPILTDSPVSAVSGFALSEHNLYHHGSPQSLAEAIDYWIEHPEERKKNAEAYAGFADRFGFEKSMNQMETMWQEVIANYAAKK